MPTVRQALGKGIGALIPSNPPRREPEPKTATDAGPPSEGGDLVPIGAIGVNPRQPRTHFDEGALAELANSIREQGILQPLLVRQLGSRRYELIAGERRLRAARLAGLEQVPVLVKDVSDSQSLVLAIVENVQRADLSPLEEAQAYKELIEECRLTQEEVATQVGKSRPTIANTLRLLQLPAEIREQIAAGRISAGHARALLGLDAASAQKSLAREVVERKLSVRDTERAVLQARKGAPKPGANGPDPDVKRIESDLSRALGTKVTVEPGRGANPGCIRVEYYSDDDLARLADLLAPRRRAGLVERG